MKPKERWPTPKDLAELVGEIRRVTLYDTDRIFEIATQLQNVLADRATYADTLAVFASLLNMIQDDDDMPRGICVLALGAACGVPVKRQGDDGAIVDVFDPPPPPAAEPKPAPARGHLRLVKPLEGT